MVKRISLTTIARTLAVVALIGFVAQVAVPVIAHARRPKCVAVGVDGKPGYYVVKCSTSRS